jgi:hypothetical protein
MSSGSVELRAGLEIHGLIVSVVKQRGAGSGSQTNSRGVESNERGGACGLCLVNRPARPFAAWGDSPPAGKERRKGQGGGGGHAGCSLLQEAGGLGWRACRPGQRLGQAALQTHGVQPRLQLANPAGQEHSIACEAQQAESHHHKPAAQQQCQQAAVGVVGQGGGSGRSGPPAAAPAAGSALTRQSYPGSPAQAAHSRNDEARHSLWGQSVRVLQQLAQHGSSRAEEGVAGLLQSSAGHDSLANTLCPGLWYAPLYRRAHVAQAASYWVPQAPCVRNGMSKRHGAACKKPCSTCRLTCSTAMPATALLLCPDAWGCAQERVARAMIARRG